MGQLRRHKLMCLLTKARPLSLLVALRWQQMALAIMLVLETWIITAVETTTEGAGDMSMLGSTQVWRMLGFAKIGMEIAVIVIYCCCQGQFQTADSVATGQQNDPNVIVMGQPVEVCTTAASK